MSFLIDDFYLNKKAISFWVKTPLENLWYRHRCLKCGKTKRRLIKAEAGWNVFSSLVYCYKCGNDKYYDFEYSIGRAGTWIMLKDIPKPFFVKIWRKLKGEKDDN